jgi:hypothetical protein
MSRAVEELNALYAAAGGRTDELAEAIRQKRDHVSRLEESIGQLTHAVIRSGFELGRGNSPGG